MIHNNQPVSWIRLVILQFLSQGIALPIWLYITMRKISISADRSSRTQMETFLCIILLGCSLYGSFSTLFYLVKHLQNSPLTEMKASHTSIAISLLGLGGMAFLFERQALNRLATAPDAIRRRSLALGLLVGSFCISAITSMLYGWDGWGKVTMMVVESNISSLGSGMLSAYIYLVVELCNEIFEKQPVLENQNPEEKHLSS